MTTTRAEDRKFHYTYKVTCSYNGRVFYGVHSSDALDEGFTGSGHSLSISKSEYGVEQHVFNRVKVYATRIEASVAYNELKANQIANPIRPEDKKFHFVYKTTRFDGKFYIGVHSTDDLNDGYKGSGTHIIHSLKKHGWDKHEREILELCETRDAAFDKEKELVTEDLVHDPLCMNSIAGGRQHGNRVYGVTEETRQKLSEKGKVAHASGKFEHLKGKPQSPSSIEKRVAKNTGKKRTPEQLVNLAQGQQGYYTSADPEVLKERGQQAARTRTERGTNLGGRPKGIPMSEEQKARQSAASKGKTLSAEHRLNLKKPKTRISCMFCQKETTTSHLPRYHAACS